MSAASPPPHRTDDGVAAVDGADEVHALDSARLDALLDDHRDRCVELALQVEALPELLGAVHAARVWRHDDGIDEALVDEVAHADGRGFEVIDGHARPEEALDLAAVQVDGDDAVDAHGLQEAAGPGGGAHHHRQSGQQHAHAARAAAHCPIGLSGVWCRRRRQRRRTSSSRATSAAETGTRACILRSCRAYP